MKRYTDLTHEELIVLQDESIERLIDIEIANKGIMPVGCPVVPSVEAEGIVKSEIAYEVGGILIKNEEDAFIVSRMEQFSTAYDYAAGGYNYQWLDPVTERTITKKNFYRQSDVVRIKEILQRNKSKREEYEKLKGEYDKFLEITGKIRDAVYSFWREALNLQREIDEAKAVLEKYRGLSDGDETVAINFFKNTYKTREDIIEKVLNREAEV